MRGYELITGWGGVCMHLEPSNHAGSHVRPCVTCSQRTSHESNSRAMGKGRSGLIFCTVDLLREGERGERIGIFAGLSVLAISALICCSRNRVVVCFV